MNIHVYLFIDFSAELDYEIIENRICFLMCCINAQLICIAILNGTVLLMKIKLA